MFNSLLLQWTINVNLRSKNTTFWICNTGFRLPVTESHYTKACFCFWSPGVFMIISSWELYFRVATSNIKTAIKFKFFCDRPSFFYRNLWFWVWELKFSIGCSGISANFFLSSYSVKFKDGHGSLDRLDGMGPGWDIRTRPDLLCSHS